MPAYDLCCTKCGKYQERFVTFHAQDSGEQIDGHKCVEEQCDGIMKQKIQDRAMTWNTSGGTRGFGRTAKTPEFDQSRNFGHNPITVGEMGLDRNDCKELGIQYD